MSSDHNHIDPITLALEFLLATSPKDLEDSADINNATACLSRIKYRRKGSGSVAAPPMALPSATESREDDGATSHPEPFRYAHMAISEVAVEILKTEAGGKALSLNEIIERAQAGGYRFDGSSPNSSARAAFIRRAKGVGDLIQTTRTHWGLREWYTQREITYFRHSENTKAGMDAAKARGKMGKGWAINAEQAATIKKRLAAGETQRAVGADYGVSAQTIYRYNKLLADWSPGDPFPPKPKNEPDDLEDKGPKLRAVE